MKRGEPFAKMLPSFRKSLDDGIVKLQGGFAETVQEVFEMVLTDFDLLFVVEDIPDPQKDILREQVKEFVLLARQKIHGPITREFALATEAETTITPTEWDSV